MEEIRIAYFISAHGFGHAARAAAIISSLSQQLPSLHVTIYSAVPDWFFSDSLTAGYTHIPSQVDVGLSQKTALQEDLPDTIRRLGEYLPFTPEKLQPFVDEIKASGCACVICDISPLGIAVAREAGIPSFLVENFTWDWIYRGYQDFEPALAPFIKILRATFAEATYRIQTRPFCAPAARAHLVTRPVSRKVRSTRAEVRERLNLPEQARVILVTMGGIQEKYTFLENLPEDGNVYFVIPGSVEKPDFRSNLRLLPHHSDFYHPDLLSACDGVVGKVGYSTLAETYHAGIPFGYVARDKLPESPCLTRFIKAYMNGLEIPIRDFNDGSWVHAVPELLALGKFQPDPTNGADQAARFITKFL